MKADANFKKKEVVNYAQVYNGKIILFETGVSQMTASLFVADVTTSCLFTCTWNLRVVLYVFLLGGMENTMSSQISVCAAQTKEFNIVDSKKKQKKTAWAEEN